MSEKIWSDEAWDDYIYWQLQDKKTLKRINQLIKDIERNGCMEGIGNPEPLKGDLQGEFSRWIDEKKTTCLPYGRWTHLHCSLSRTLQRQIRISHPVTRLSGIFYTLSPDDCAYFIHDISTVVCFLL